MVDNKKANIWRRSIDEVMDESFGRYAKYIIQDRALPDARDGLKPVQRRILYAMNDLHITYDRAYKKSARTVGEVIGKYHPHGDSSIYEAMVRMSQDWKNNWPLLDMHGNNGSIDGDNAAAMRYTECRLSKVSSLMINNIEKNTVEFALNFDDSETEPTVLPSLFPNLLVNGAMGIAAGYATNIPPFNFNEVINATVHRIDNPNCRVDKIIKLMPGPDFPTGGIIQGTSGIRDAYETGRGKFIIRSRIYENPVNKKMHQLVVTEIPYETNKAHIIRSIDEIIFNEKMPGIIEVRDESDRKGISIVIDIEASRSLETVRNYLYKNTALQISYNINFVAIERRKPILMPIVQALDSFINHAIIIITKTAEFDLNKALKRQEIVIGLIKAIKIIDDVIYVIRRSTGKEDAKQKIMVKFGFSVVQAEAIVTLRLYKLSATDIDLLKLEADELQLRISELKLILGSSEIKNNLLKTVLRDYKKEYNQPRKTDIEVEIDKIIIEDADIIDKRDVVVFATHDGYVKTVSKRSIDSSNYKDVTFKDGDILVSHFNSNTLDRAIFITNSGKYINVPVHKIKTLKWKDNGEHLNNCVTISGNEKIIFGFNVTNLIGDDRLLMIATNDGLIKRVKVSDLSNSKNAKIANIINLKEDAEIVSADLFEPSLDDPVGIITKHGFGMMFNSNEIPVVGKTAAGVKSIKLRKNDGVISAFRIHSSENIVTILAARGCKRISVQELKSVKRGHPGALVLSQLVTKPYVMVNAFIANARDLINILDNDNQWFLWKPSEINISDHNTRISSLKDVKSIKMGYRDDYTSGSIVKGGVSPLLDDENEDEYEGEGQLKLFDKD